MVQGSIPCSSNSFAVWLSLFFNQKSWMNENLCISYFWRSSARSGLALWWSIRPGSVKPSQVLRTDSREPAYVFHPSEAHFTRRVRLCPVRQVADHYFICLLHVCYDYMPVARPPTLSHEAWQSQRRGECRSPGAASQTPALPDHENLLQLRHSSRMLLTRMALRRLGIRTMLKSRKRFQHWCTQHCEARL